MSSWNPLYPSDEDVDSLEESAREAEWEDDMKRTRRKKSSFDDDETEEDD